MDYTLAGLRQRILVDKLDDDEFDPGVVDNFINDTQRDIFNEFELPFMEKIFAGTVPLGTTMFTFPSDVSQIQSHVVTGPDGTEKDLANCYMDFRSFNKLYPVPGNNTAGPIHAWTLYANAMRTSAPTDQEYTMTVFYTKTPTKLTQDADVPELPEDFAELLVLGAYVRCLERNEDEDLAEKFEAKYEKKKLQLVTRYGFRQSNGPIKMKNGQTGQQGGRNTTRNGLVQKSY